MLDRDDWIDVVGQVRQVGEQRLAFRALERRVEIRLGVEPQLGEAVVTELREAIPVDEVDRVPAHFGSFTHSFACTLSQWSRNCWSVIPSFLRRMPSRFT